MASPMDSVPDEVLDLVLRMLDHRDLVSAMKTCRRLRSLADDQRHWEGQFFPVSPRQSGSSSSNTGSPPCPTFRLCHSAAVDKAGRMWCFGGDQGNPYEGVILTTLSDLACWEAETRTWRSWTDQAYPRLTEHSAVVWHDSMLLFGGNTGKWSQQGAVFSDAMYTVDVGAGAPERDRPPKMTEVKPGRAGPRPSARSAHSAVLYGDSMVVFGGWDSRRTFNDLWVWSCEERVWMEVPGSGDVPGPRRTHKAVVYGDLMMVFGGFVEGALGGGFSDVFALDLKSWIWKRVQPFGAEAPCARARATLTADPFSDRLLLVGGWDRTAHFGDLYELSIREGSNWQWRKIRTNLSSLVGGIAQHSSVVMGRWLVVFAGFHDNNRACSSQVLALRLSGLSV